MSTADRSGGLDPAYDWQAAYDGEDVTVEEARSKATEDIWVMEEDELKLAAGALYTHPDKPLDDIYDGPEEVYKELDGWQDTALEEMEDVEPEGELAGYDVAEVVDDNDGNPVLTDGENRLTLEEPISGLHSVYDGDSNMFLDEA